jgi:protein-disulfide isomerase
MSRRHDARRKAQRRQARADAESPPQGRQARSRRLVTVVPVFLIAAILAVVGAVGFGAGSGPSQEQSRQEVAALLAGIPQKGATLGSARAPITLRVYGDLECPTVKRFAVSYLPSIVATWVRTGEMQLEYRSLQTDTRNEHTFFEQEVAALAAGRQDKMWNFLLTFVHEQKRPSTEYATEEFLIDIASQVPGLNRAHWRRDRGDPVLSRQVALGVHSAHVRNLYSTPSLLLGFTNSKADRSVSLDDPTSLRRKIEFSLRGDIESLRERATADVPTLGIFGLAKRD